MIVSKSATDEKSVYDMYYDYSEAVKVWLHIEFWQ